VILALAAAAALAAASDDWPCWRGPRHDGVSLEQGWTDAGKPLWERDVGLGHSSCVVVGTKLYTAGFDVERSIEVVWCLDAETGAAVWTRTYPAELRAVGHGGGTHSTPSVDGADVFVSDRVGTLRCLDAATGEVRWAQDLAAELGVQPNEYGYGGSPLVLGERVIQHAGKVAALERASGKVLWSTPDHVALYSTPTPLELAGQLRIAAFTKEGLHVLVPETGAELFRRPWRKGNTTVNAATPVVVGERVFISSGYGHGCALVAFDPAGLVRTEWESKVMQTVLSGCVLVDGCLYGFDESRLKCIGLDGTEKWRKRGLGQGALAAADGRLIVMSEKGELVILRATPEAYTELSRTPLMDGGSCWTTPTLAGGRIYCRNGAGRLVARDHRPER
jgi:outer membrane protein assembly factor BamB